MQQGMAEGKVEERVPKVARTLRLWFFALSSCRMIASAIEYHPNPVHEQRPWDLT